jgi:hypothetical protein
LKITTVQPKLWTQITKKKQKWMLILVANCAACLLRANNP